MKRKVNKTKIICFILAIAVFLTVSVITAFSWYDRTAMPEADARIIEYNLTAKTAGNGPKTIKTYAGNFEDGVLKYSDTEVSEDITTYPGKVNYFKTVITETTNAGDSVISVHYDTISISSNVHGGCHIGLTSPEKTYQVINGQTVDNKTVYSDVCIEDEVFVKSNGTTEIYWYIQADDGDYEGTGTLNLGNLYYIYE